MTVNCAALPATLVESELFGYEKGAFTGAVQRTIGRFEVAHGGSLFLDEIGELPLEVQAKLLRVLQTGEFERLGSAKTIQVDVRLIAATNRDLEREVREGRFRADLFYRLSVFPIALPPLRERREDIPLLVWHFIGRRQAALGRVVNRVPERLMRAFAAYSWPGNVRELENVVERALIMTNGATLAADPAFLEAAPLATEAGPSASLAEAERAHIRAVLDAVRLEDLRQGQRRRSPRPQAIHPPVPHEEARPVSPGPGLVNAPFQGGDVGPPGPELDALLRFEEYLADVAALLLKAPPDALDGEVSQALRGLLDALDVDRCGIGLFGEGAAVLQLTHSVGRPGIPEQPLVDIAPVLPWYAEQVRQGRTLVWSRIPEGIPPEALAERAYVTRTEMKSHISVPMKAGGETQGGLGVACMRTHREWGSLFVPRLELLAGIFASAFYRRAAEARMREADELNRSILASLANQVAVVDAGGRIVVLNEAWTRSAARAAFPSVSVGDDLLASLEAASAGGYREVGEIEALRSVLGGRTRAEALCQHPGSPGPRVYLVSATRLQGATSGAVVVHADVTEIHETKASLQASLQEARELKDRLEAENAALQTEVRRAEGYDEIVGTSAAIGRVLAQVEQVASTDAPVLLLGETGTGKDLVARALHRRSGRRERPLVTVNCAALPATLFESELFGYERGAFTGALQRTIGRFEVAHGGSLFLDEIGETPLDVQAKLLRVLETGELERLGSAKTIKVDVRLIAATNRDLERAVREGRFRADLYYRLNVFPIPLPPLRERREDIPLLVWHFIGLRQASLGRTVTRVPARLMRAFAAFSWPGNARELKNVVERALIMTRRATLAADPDFLKGVPGSPEAGPGASLAEADRAHIRAVLDACGWKISGKGNAADRLGLPRSTLQSCMKRLGITRTGS